MCSVGAHFEGIHVNDLKHTGTGVSSRSDNQSELTSAGRNGIFLVLLLAQTRSKCSSGILVTSSSEPSDESRDADLSDTGLMAFLKPLVTARCSGSFFPPPSEPECEREDAADDEDADRASESSDELAGDG